MKDDEYKGYYCLLIAILCNLNGKITFSIILTT